MVMAKGGGGDGGRGRDCVQPLLQALHWSPVQARIDYKLSTIRRKFLSDSSPAYPSKRLTVYTPSRQLRSSTNTRILHMCTKQWDSLPSDIPHIGKISPHAFKTALKTHLYKQYHNKSF